MCGRGGWIPTDCVAVAGRSCSGVRQAEKGERFRLGTCMVWFLA